MPRCMDAEPTSDIYPSHLRASLWVSECLYPEKYYEPVFAAGADEFEIALMWMLPDSDQRQALARGSQTYCIRRLSSHRQNYS